MSGPSVHIGLPPLALLRVPDQLPTVQYQFVRWLQNREVPILPALYSITLDPRFPLIFAAIYVSTVLFTNRLNNRRKNKPWTFSRTRAFRMFVLAHNVSLALLSAWVLFAVCDGLRTVWPAKHEEHYSVRIVESICRMRKAHGPPDLRTLGDTVIGNRESHNAEYLDDIWDEWHNRMHYVFWIFYLTKFYEIVDTAIILTSGRESSLLHTYHHTGVLICGWASLRFECPAVLVAVVLNSAIHTIMYIYYALAAIRIRMPNLFKMLLSSAQITQFVTGSLIGICYIFIYHVVEVHTPSNHSHTDLEFFDRKTSNAAMDRDITRPDKAGTENSSSEVTYRTVSCLANDGQVFVIWSGMVFLMPLLYLFIRFFEQAYIRPRKVKLV